MLEQFGLGGPSRPEWYINRTIHSDSTLLHLKSYPGSVRDNGGKEGFCPDPVEARLLLRGVDGTLVRTLESRIRQVPGQNLGR